MRVTGGILGGRNVAVPRGDKVRPTQDRVREALFSALAPRLSGARFLDLFAGAGSVGLEAWSRGAAYVCWVESDQRVYEALARNVETLCGSQSGGSPDAGWKTVRSEVFRFIDRFRDGQSYDMVFADPPYDRDGTRQWSGRLLECLAKSRRLAAGGLLIVEQASDEAEAVHPAWVKTGGRVYGGTRLNLYSRKDEVRP